MGESVATTAARPPPGSTGQRQPIHPRLERWVLWHVGVLIVSTAWNFGGMAPWARPVVLGWGSVGIALLLAALPVVARRERTSALALLRPLWPLLLLDALVVAGCFNPSAQLLVAAGEKFLQFRPPPHAWLPSTVRPAQALQELWLLNGIVLSCFNLWLVCRRRRALRRLLVVVAANALLLAIFGTFQKLVRAEGLWFGLVPSPQEYFFSTFVYHNHWGAFTVLNVAACLGLLFHQLRRTDARDGWHSPAPAGAVAILLLAATGPLSGSRSATVLLALLLGAALTVFLLTLVRRRRAERRAVAGPVVAGVLAAVLAGAAIGYLAREVIARRARHTTEQLARLHQPDTLDARAQLYRDTVRLAQEKPWFGWGLESYGDAFRVFNSQRSVEGWTPYYAQAHSDWLQAWVELGVVGTGLLVALGLAPLAGIPWRRVRSPVPRSLLAGAGLVALYAWVEFPYANSSVLIAFWMSLYVAARYARLEVERPADHG